MFSSLFSAAFILFSCSSLFTPNAVSCSFNFFWLAASVALSCSFRLVLTLFRSLFNWEN